MRSRIRSAWHEAIEVIKQYSTMRYYWGMERNFPEGYYGYYQDPETGDICAYGKVRQWWNRRLIGFYLKFIWSVLLAMRCGFTDHDWIDNSTAGPDSGDMDMYCRRCGKTFHHQLY